MRLRVPAVLVLLLITASPLHAASEILPGVFLIRGEFVPGSQPDGNSVILTAPDGLIVVDTGRHVAHTEAIVAFARASKLPVRAVINTHWHLDHIGGNAMLRREFPDVRIYASGALAGARKGFLAKYRGQLQGMLDGKPEAAAEKQFRAELALIDAGDQLVPDVTITAAGTRAIAGRELTIGLESHAVTEGDVWIEDAKDGLLIAGDLVTLPAPFLDTACPSRWKATLDRIAERDFELLVPGHGAPMTRRQFQIYRRAFDELLACAAREGAKEPCIDAWTAGTALLAPGGDARFTKMLMDYYVDVLRRDAAQLAPLCGE